MSITLVTVKFAIDKTCFVALSREIAQSELNKEIQVFEIEVDGGDKVYVSWSGEGIRSVGTSDGVLQINGLFGEKLGLKDNQQVIIRPVKRIPQCIQVNVEPLSVDDWEILDRHTAFIESHLLDQVRVIQKDRVYPVWVEKSVCVFIKIGIVNPEDDCVLLVNESKVILKSKVRSPGIVRTLQNEPIKKQVTDHMDVPDESITKHITDHKDLQDEPMKKHGEELEVPEWYRTSPDDDATYSRYNSADLESFNPHPNRKMREKLPYELSNITAHWRKFVSYLGFLSLKGTAEPTDEDESDQYEDESTEESELMLPSGLNLVLRVQNMKYKQKESNNLVEEYTRRRGNESLRTNGSSPPRKQRRDVPTKSGQSFSQIRPNFKFDLFPQQPSCVYLDMSDVEKQFKFNRFDIPSVFYAKICRLPPPREMNDKEKRKNSQLPPQKISKFDQTNKGATSPQSEKPEPTSPHAHDENMLEKSCVVRVIVIDTRRRLCRDDYLSIVKCILQDQQLLKGHVIIPDMLRRYLQLDVTSRVWLQTIKSAPTCTSAFSLYHLGNMTSNITNDMVMIAFKQWLDQVSVDDYPMVVCQGLLLHFPVYEGISIDAQLTYNEKDVANKCSFTLLHPGIFKTATLSVINGSRSNDLTHPAIQPMLGYISLSSIDPFVPNNSITNIGGLSELIETTLSCIEICLGSRTLHREVFSTIPGLQNGMILLTGSKGSGKTTVARAILKELTELPNFAFTYIVDCKPLRGKKVETIQKKFDEVFDEAAWRQPSVILLDDLDHIAGAPAGPELEMTVEAMYSARVAEVLKDLLRKDIRNMSNIAVLVTSQSRSTLHPILTSSRGVHLVQEVIHIKSPDKKQRTKIIKTMMLTRSIKSSLTDSELDLLAQKTEGFMARDLENIINRAIHAHILKEGQGALDDTDIELLQSDFDEALKEFIPTSIRSVPLHQPGELGWHDIGGLTDIKQILIETLQWPTKYPALFANCPLRLRSGLLLYGAPGTGKTLLAGVVAKECGLNFISIKGPELLSKYIGASEQAVRDLFLRASSAKPCILFFDEFDSIAPRRGHDNTGVTDRVVNQLLTQLDGVEGLDGVYVLAATSRPDLVDPALLRPGRFDKCLHCQLPNKDERKKILKALAKRLTLHTDVELDHFAVTCQDFTGADLKALLYNAQLEAIHELTSFDESSSQETGTYGMKSGKHFTAQLKSRSKSLQLDVKRERRKSFTSGKLAYIPSLEKGVVQVLAEQEEKLTSQVSQIQLKERRTHDAFAHENTPESPFQAKLLVITQKHLLSAASDMRPSVSGAERTKYQRIYQNFISSRGGQFETGFMEAGKMKATLA